MSIDINWSLNIAVTGGPRIGLNNKPPLVIDAYDVVTTTLAANATGVNVDLQPSGGAGDVVLLAMSSDLYDPTLTYDPGGGAQPLDAPLFLIGTGAIAMLGATPPTSLSFDNGINTPVNIQILVGRKV